MRQQTISIGGVRVRLRSSLAGFWSCADRFYSGFYTPDDDLFDDTIDIAVSPDSQQTESEVALRDTATRIDDDGQLEVVHPCGVAQWDRQRRSGCVRLAEWDDRRNSASPEYVCHSLVTAVVAHRLLERQACLVHAASLIRDHRGFLFVGPSRAGKSTIARLSAPTCSVLGDDTSLVAQSEGAFWILGTPFLRQFQSVTAAVRAPLTAICFLHQATSNALVPVPKARAAWELFRSARYTNQYPATAQALLDLVARICSQVSCYQLHFRPDSSFWRCFDD